MVDKAPASPPVSQSADLDGDAPALPPVPPPEPVSDFAPNSKLDEQFVAQTLQRPDFDPKGKLIARTELRFGEVTYFPTAPLPSLEELAPFGLDERLLLVLWRNGKIDTYPNEEEAAAVANVHGAPDASGHDRPLPGTLVPKAPTAPTPKKKR